jgi:hypothetical protein
MTPTGTPSNKQEADATEAASGTAILNFEPGNLL